MRDRFTGPLLLLLLPSLALSACTSLGGYEVDARDLTVQWCPASQELTWTFEFGYDDGEVETQPWTGGYLYSLSGPRFGAGGGGTTCSHPRMRGLGETGEAPPVSRWRLSGTLELSGMPETFSVEIGDEAGIWSSVNGHPVRGDFELSAPPVSADSECVLLDVRLKPEPTE